MELNKKIENALEELRKGKERKFVQSVDLIINLQKFDAKKSNISIFTEVPNKIKDKKICAFLEEKSNLIETITESEFKKYSEKKEVKKIAKKFDFFISQAKMMPKVASSFGRILGPIGKMPSPQLGIIMNSDEKSIEGIIKKINNSIKIKIKEPSIKIAVGKQSMENKKLIENILAVYASVLKVLPKEKDNIRSIEVKFTMTKPIKIPLK